MARQARSRHYRNLAASRTRAAYASDFLKAFPRAQKAAPLRRHGEGLLQSLSLSTHNVDRCSDVAERLV